MTEALRRRVLYIRHRRSIDIAENFRANQDEWVEALALNANVSMIDTDFDMDETCDRVRPDFILYESPFFFAVPLSIKNVAAHPHIPRLAFQMQDPYCSIRVKFLRTMEALGIKWMFTHMTETALRQSPEFAASTFSVSLLFDNKIFNDYGQQKDIPVSVMGGLLLPDLYSWRAEIVKDLPKHFPTLLYTHPGYQNPVPRHKFQITGEAYARMLNRSHFSLADSTELDCLVRKHLEIPACGSILIAPDAPVLKPYGFRDMENCILGSGPELFKKIASVADDPALYERIQKAGYDLVHNRYTRQNWRGILDFYECLRTLKPGQTIRQQGVLGPFIAVDESEAGPNAIIAEIPPSSVSVALKRWMDLIRDAHVKINAEDFKQIPGCLSHSVEPFVLLGILMLMSGNPQEALNLLSKPQQLRLEQSGFAEYDPEEIAWLSLVGALMGNAELLALTRKESANMRYLSIRRMQWLGKILANNGDIRNPPESVRHRHPADQISIHQTGQLEIDQWISLISRIMIANGQAGLAAQHNSDRHSA